MYVYNYLSFRQQQNMASRIKIMVVEWFKSDGKMKDEIGSAIKGTVFLSNQKFDY